MIKIKIDRTYGSKHYGIWIADIRGEKIFVAKPITLEFEERPETFYDPNPALQLRAEDAGSFLRALAEALSDAGIQYNIEPPQAAELSAVKAHLKDSIGMRDRLLTCLEKELTP